MKAMTELRRIINELAPPTEKSLFRAAKSLTANIDDLVEYLAPPAGYPYGRQRIEGIQNESVEAIVMNWAPEFECSPHDHAESVGCFVVVSGVVHERRYRLNTTGLLSVKRHFIHETGDVVFAPRALIHSMKNPGNSQLVTLHFYTPPITRMRVFDPAKCRGCFVKVNCGAWWPNAEQLDEEFSIDVSEHMNA